MNENQKVEIEFRGPSTSRHLSSELEESSGAGVPVLDMLGMDLQDIEGKRTLDVGPGQGVAFREALDEEYDWIACDIAPAVNIAKNELLLASSNNAKGKLEQIAAEYPGRVIAADAADSIPLVDNAVDIAISCVGLPNYARDEREMAKSILEMTRVAGERVVFTLGSNVSNILDQNDGIAYFGAKNTFGFPLKKFLNEVYGEENWSFIQGHRKGENFTSVSIDCANKDLGKIKNYYDDIGAGDEMILSRLKAD